MSDQDIERAEVAVASDSLDKPLFWLRFSARLEQQYLRDGAAGRVNYVARSGALSLLIFNGFLVADYLMAHDVLALAIKVRLGVFTPIALLLLSAIWFAPKWVIKNIPPLVFEALLALTGVFASACLAYILASSHSPTSQYYHVGQMVVVMYGNVVQRLRFGYAVATSAVVYAMHIGGVLMLDAFNPRLVLPMVAMVGATVVFTLMANFAWERDHRRNYLLSLRRQHLTHDLNGVRARLQQLSRIDPLTGLYNRRHLEWYLQQVWRRALHGGEEVALIMIDIDHFKKYNDLYGHTLGDQCLTRVAKALADGLRRAGDLVARIGGEEFIVVLPQTDPAEAYQAAERVRQAVQALQIEHADSVTAAVVTCSLGVASCRVQSEQTDTQLIAQADAALYRAKQAGRNQVAS